MTDPAFIPLPNYRSYPLEEMQGRAAQLRPTCSAGVRCANFPIEQCPAC
jgi:hypothetical protein